jgi:hypothetical protein
MTPDAHPEEAVEAAHPFRVAAGEVVVHGDDVYAFAFERVEVGGQGGNERLALASLHLGDGAFVQDHPADELHVEVPHVEHALSGFAHDGERFDEEIIEARAVSDALTEFGRFLPELLVGQLLDGRLESANLCDERTQPLYLSFVLGTDYLRE